MYEDFRKDLLLTLSESSLTEDQIREVVSKIDMVSLNYTFERKSQELVVRGRDKLEEAAKLYLISKQLEGCAKGTLDNYYRHINSFVLYCPCPLSEIDANVVRKYFLLYKMDHKISDRSLDKLRQDLQAWFRWMQNEGYIVRNPMANISKIKHVVKRKQSLTQTELEQLRDCCRNDKERCLVEVLYSTGCRISEALNIKVSEIRFDLPQPECEVVGKGNKQRTVYFSPRAISTIKKYLSTRKHMSDWLFINDRGGEQMCRENAEKIFRKLRELAGLQDKKFTPHTLRHTTATQAIKVAPVEIVQKMLGHSKIDTTMLYADTSQDDVKAYHAKII
ncbi:MAG: tyrosine-type recombinase/integrase [Bacteroidaceae bacterium]|nr:tyrosine-type recombinase/integrase [Bacteroidaceae bacterium]